VRAPLQLPDEDRKRLQAKRRRIAGDREPVHLLAIDFEVPCQRRFDKRRKPGSGRHHEPIRRVSIAVGSPSRLCPETSNDVIVSSR
jgi:hypothetical protein